MPIPILMPALSPTMEEGTLAKWLVKEGDNVEAGDVIAEIETDKATMEVEAVDEGTLARILVQDGTDEVAVNAPIALLLEEGEDASALEGFSVKPLNGSRTPQEPEKSAPEPSPVPPAPEALPVSPAVQIPQAEDRIFASPLARRLAGEKGIDLASVDGTGPHGRIIKRDIESYEPKAAPATQPSEPSKEAKAPPPGLFVEGRYETIKLDGMRKTIAARMTESKRDVPHYYLTIDCEIDALLETRKELNAKSPEGEGSFKISVNDFVIRACALSLIKVPEANRSFTEEAIIQHKHADVAIAVAIEGGLITPIVFDAEAKGLSAIAREVQDLAARARDRKLMPEEYQGGTFSISNLGMFGVKHFTAVINSPHACILAVGAGEKRPVIKDNAVSSATIMTCTMSCDHRVVDGAVGAQFLQAFKGYIEDPLTMLL